MNDSLDGYIIGFIFLILTIIWTIGVYIYGWNFGIWIYILFPFAFLFYACFVLLILAILMDGW